MWGISAFSRSMIRTAPRFQHIRFPAIFALTPCLYTTSCQAEHAQNLPLLPVVPTPFARRAAAALAVLTGLSASGSLETRAEHDAAAYSPWVDAKQREAIPMAAPTQEPKSPGKVTALTRYAVADAVEKVLPSVVNIRRVIRRPALSMLFSGDTELDGITCGSGFFISRDGLVLTNAHVVSGPEGTDDTDAMLHVTLSSGECYVGKVVAADFLSDIALVKINTEGHTPVAMLGDSEAVRAGEFVVAVGSPLTLSNSCSFGIVSTIHRDLPMVNDEPCNGLMYLQLDVAINQGSSGGPCVSLDGEVIGICSMKISGDAEGIGFAIPMQYATRVVDDLQKHGYVRRPYVGLSLISVTPDLFEDIRQDTSYRPPRWLEAEMRHTNNAKSVGLMVHHVTKGGPGHKAGLRPGDVVVRVNGIRTTTTLELLAALSFQVDKDCDLTVRRGASGEVNEITIRPGILHSQS